MKRRIGIVLLLGAFLLTGCKKEPTWQDQYDLGMKYLEEGDYEEALASFQAAVAIDDKKTETYTQMLTVYEEQNEESQAEETIWDMVDKVKKEEIAYEDTYDFWENVVEWCKNNDRENLIDEIYYKIHGDTASSLYGFNTKFPESPLSKYYMDLGMQYAEYYNARLSDFFSEVLAQTNIYLKNEWRGYENMWYASQENFSQENGGGVNLGESDIEFYDDELGQAVMDYGGVEDKAGNFKLHYCKIKISDVSRKMIDFSFRKLDQYIEERDSGYEVIYVYNPDGSVNHALMNEKFRAI